MRAVPRRALALFVFTLLAAPLVAVPPADPVARLDALAERGRADWGVPGLAVAVVKDGKVLLAKGYGVRELGKPGLVDADTLFAA
ncbi:MAG: serine hydrolase, partial [Myxococcota bacterium]